MIDPTLTISIDRADMGLGPLLMSGSDADATPLAIVGYQEPAMQARILYAPTSDYVHGEMPLAVTWQQSILGFDVAPIGAGSEAAADSFVAELTAAVGRLSYLVTVAINDAPPKVWTCTAGSLAPAGGRDYVNLRDHNPVWGVTLPCHPIPA